MIKSDVYKLKGKWVMEGTAIIKDSICVQIEYLISNSLKKIENDDTGWNTLYQDPENNQYWELTYDSSEAFGGGPPTLTRISLERANQRYSLIIDI